MKVGSLGTITSFFCELCSLCLPYVLGFSRLWAFLVVQMVKNLIPGLGRSPEEGNDYTLQYSCLENSMDRGTWRATVRGVTKSQTQLSN